MSLFLFILIFCSGSAISTSPSFSLLIHSFVLFALLLIYSGLFFISVLVFFISIWLFFVFSDSLLKISNISLCASILLPSSLIIFIITTQNHFRSRLPTSTSLSSSSEVLPCHLILPNLLFLFLSLVAWLCFPSLEKEPFAGDIVPAAQFPVVTRAICSSGFP